MGCVLSSKSHTVGLREAHIGGSLVLVNCCAKWEQIFIINFEGKNHFPALVYFNDNIKNFKVTLKENSLIYPHKLIFFFFRLCGPQKIPGVYWHGGR